MRLEIMEFINLPAISTVVRLALPLASPNETFLTEKPVEIGKIEQVDIDIMRTQLAHDMAKHDLVEEPNSLASLERTFDEYADPVDELRRRRGWPEQ